MKSYKVMKKFVSYDKILKSDVETGKPHPKSPPKCKFWIYCDKNGEYYYDVPGRNHDEFFAEHFGDVNSAFERVQALNKNKK